MATENHNQFFADLSEDKIYNDPDSGRKHIVGVLSWENAPRPNQDLPVEERRAAYFAAVDELKKPLLDLFTQTRGARVPNPLGGSPSAIVSATPAAWAKLRHHIPDNVELRHNDIVATTLERPNEAGSAQTPSGPTFG